jgi:integrase
LEIYLLIGGWLGLRPSEIQRLSWSAFDWTHEGHGYCHVSPKVAQKNSSERYVPMDSRLSARLHALFLASGKDKSARCCAFRSREFLSVLAREKGVCAEWPADVLRHSFCSYRIAVVKSLEQVATEADNSPAILKSNYRRPLRHEDGLAWWALLDLDGK